MDPHWYNVVLVFFATHMLATTGAAHQHRVARDDGGEPAAGGVLDMAKDMTNPVIAVEKFKDTIPVLGSILGGDDLNVLGLGRKRRSVYLPSSLVRMEDALDELDSEEVNWRVAHVPDETALSGAESKGMSTPSDASLISEGRERKRRLAQIPGIPSSPSVPGGTNPTEDGKKFFDSAKSGAEANGLPAPPNLPSPGSERKRRAAQFPQMAPPPSMQDGMNPAEHAQTFAEMAKSKAEASGMPAPPNPPSFSGSERKRRQTPQVPQMTPPSSMPGGIPPPPSSMPGEMPPPPSMPSGVTPPDNVNPANEAKTYSEMAKSGAEGVTPPSKGPSVPDGKRKRRQSTEDMTDEMETKRTKSKKQGGKGKKGRRGKGKGKSKSSTTTPETTDYP